MFYKTTKEIAEQKGTNECSVSNVAQNALSEDSTYTLKRFLLNQLKTTCFV